MQDIRPQTGSPIGANEACANETRPPETWPIFIFWLLLQLEGISGIFSAMNTLQWQGKNNLDVAEIHKKALRD